MIRRPPLPPRRDHVRRPRRRGAGTRTPGPAHHAPPLSEPTPRATPRPPSTRIAGARGPRHQPRCPHDPGATSPIARAPGAPRALHMHTRPGRDRPGRHLTHRPCTRCATGTPHAHTTSAAPSGHPSPVHPVRHQRPAHTDGPGATVRGVISSPVHPGRHRQPPRADDSWRHRLPPSPVHPRRHQPPRGTYDRGGTPPHPVAGAPALPPAPARWTRHTGWVGRAGSHAAGGAGTGCARAAA